jgi:hypothetical protein
MGSPSTLRWVPNLEEEYIERNPRSGMIERWLTLYAKVGPRNGRRIHTEKSTFRHSRTLAHPLCKGESRNGRRMHREIHGPEYMSVGSSSIQRWVPEMKEEEYIEINPRSVIYERWLSIYAKVGPRNGRRIHREKSMVRHYIWRHIRAWAHSLR